MKFWKVDDLEHMNEHIHYNKQYKGNVYLGDEVYPMRFRIEKDVFGDKIEDIEIDGKQNYPMLDLKKNIEEYIKENIL